LRVEDLGWVGVEIAEVADNRAIVEELIHIIDLRAGDGELHAGGSIDLEAKAIPGVAPISGVSASCPAGDVACDPADRIQCSGIRCEIDVFPMRVVEAGIGPEGMAGGGIEWRVADGEFPWTVQGDCGSAQLKMLSCGGVSGRLRAH